MLQRVAKGQKISQVFTADNINQMIDAVNGLTWPFQRQGGAGFTGATLAPAVVDILNDTPEDDGETWKAGRVVWIGAPAFPFERIDQPPPLLTSREPTGTAAVLIEPTEPGEIGRAIISGVVGIECNADSGYLDPNGEGGVQPAPTGAIRIISATGGYALVLLNAGGEGGTAAKLGFFDSRIYYKETDGKSHPVIECYNSANPESPHAGIATVNGQPFEAFRQSFPLTAAEHFLTLVYYAPLSRDEEPDRGNVALELFDYLPFNNDEQVVFVIAKVEKVTKETGTYYVQTRSQEPGAIDMVWTGPCFDLLINSLDPGYIPANG